MRYATGQDTIYLGSGNEQVQGSGVAGQVTTIYGDVAEAMANIQGEDTTPTLTTASETGLNITNGGNVMLNPSDKDLTVNLSAASNLSLGSINFIVANGGAGNDTIAAGGSNQQLSGGGGTNALIGSTSYGDSFVDTSADLSNDTIENFGGAGKLADTILASNVTYLGSIGNQFAFTEASNNLSGVLSFNDGTHYVSVTLDGSYTLSDFSIGPGGLSGTLVTFY